MDMNNDLKILARRCGRLARINAKRLQVVLTFYQSRPQGWLREQALTLSRRVEFHLRHADAIGNIIDRYEGGRRASFAAQAPAEPTRGRARPGVPVTE